MSEISENLKATIGSVKAECERLKKAADDATAEYERFMEEIRGVCIEEPVAEEAPTTVTEPPSPPKASSKNNVHPITSYCDRYGWSANDFAGHFGVSYPSVRRWEAGEKVTKRSLDKIKEEDKKLAKQIEKYQSE